MVAGQRPGGDFQQQMVLPEAEGQGDAEDDQADDDAGAQLVEVLDQGEPVLVGDRPDRGPSRRLSGGRGRPVSSSALLLGRRLGGSIGGWAGSISSCGSGSSWSSPLTEPRNSRIPRPSERAELRQAFRPEDDEGDDQDDRKL